MNRKFQMSSEQRRMFTIDQMQGQNITYNIPAFFEINGTLDKKRLVDCVHLLCQRHEVLRTHFAMLKGKFAQIIEDEVAFEVFEEEGTVSELEDSIKNFIVPFDLNVAPLMHAKIYKTGKEQHFLLFDFHHIIMDGNSIGIYVSELCALYNEVPLEPVTIQYKDYSAWKRKQDLLEQEAYWLNELSDCHDILELPCDFKRGKVQTYRGRMVSHEISADVRKKIQSLSKKCKATNYMVVMAAFAILLSKYCRNNEIMLGTPIAGRNHPDIQNMLGMFVNTLVIKNKVDSSITFTDFVGQVKEKCMQAYDHQDFPFDVLVDKLDAKKADNRNPLFDVMFALQNNEQVIMHLGNAKVKEYPVESKVAKFDLTFNFGETDQGYLLVWEYNVDLFKHQTMRRMMRHFMMLLEQGVSWPDSLVGNLTYVDGQEFDLLINGFNDTYREYPSDKTVIALFEEQVKLYPSREAVTFRGNSLTYVDVNQKANAIAHHLAAAGVKADEYVGISAVRDIAVIPGIIGILKAGGAYMPLDPKNPESRVEYILKDSECKYILQLHEDVGKKYEGIKTWNLEEIFKEKKEHAPKARNTSNNLAYLIYTSGTMGLPKGVMIEQKSIIRLVRNTTYIAFENIRVLLTGSLTFDASTFEIWGSLLNGGCVCMVDDDQLADPILLEECIQKNHANTMWLTSALYNHMISSNANMFDSLDYLLIGGERLSEPHVRKLIERNTGTRLINGYGPTECTTFALTHEISANVPESIPIGKPIANTTAYVLQGNELCGIGVPGELCLGGDGLARGYLNQKELTSKKFIANPFSKNGTLYRTGDLARWSEDGTMEYLGRIDNQVKIRGFRIELSEIRKCLLDMQNISEAEVIVREMQEDKVLCAYITLEHENSIKSVREQLRELLPEYMVPAYITVMEKLPVTKNGKIDIHALPEPQIMNQQLGKKPETIVDKNIHDVFCEVLNMEQVGMDEDFYNLGGDSIKAIRMVSKLREYGYRISLKNILKLRTIEKIGQMIAHDQMMLEEQGEITGIVGLTPIQKKFFSTQMKNPNHFNQSMMLEFTKQVDAQILGISLTKIAEHHDMLRVLFDGKQEIRTISEFGQVPLEVYEINTIFDEAHLFQYIEEKSNFAQSKLNIKLGPVFKAVLFKTPKKDYLLLICHHLLIDGISWQILLEDLQYAYNTQKSQGNISFPQKTASFSKWGNMLNGYSKSAKAEQELLHWKAVEADIKESKFSLGEPDLGKENVVSISLSKELTTSLLALAGYFQGIGAKEILITAVVRSIQKISKKDTISINLEGHGRESLDDRISVDRTIGWFTNIYPLVFKNIGASIEEDIWNINKVMAEVVSGGIGYGAINAYTGLLTGIEPAVTLNYLGEFDMHINAGEIFCMSSMPNGTDIDPENYFGTPVSINSLIIRGSLQFNVWYDSSVTNRAFVAVLIATVKKNLSDIVAYCTEKKHNRKSTPLNDYHKTQIIDKYNPTAIQKLFLDLGQQGMVENKFEFLCDSREKIVAAVRRLIQEQSAFRTSYKKEPYGYVLCEHTPETDFEIPYVEWCNTEDSDFKITESAMEDTSKQEQNFALYRLMIVKESEHSYAILLSISHSIWDKKSSVIFAEHVKKYLQSNEKTYEKIGTLSYAAKLLQNAIHSFEKQDGRGATWLAEFSANKEQYLKNEQNNKIIRYEITKTPLCRQNRENYNSQGWAFILRFVRKIIELNSCQKYEHDLPVYLVYENRSYLEKSYTNAIGPFIDLIPMNLPNPSSNKLWSVNQGLSDILNLKKQRLPSLIDWMEAENNILGIGKVYSVNYQGFFDLTDHEFQELEYQVTLKDAKSGYEIVVNELNGELVFIYPVTESCTADIKQTLMEECRRDSQ